MPLAIDCKSIFSIELFTTDWYIIFPAISTNFIWLPKGKFSILTLPFAGFG